MVVELVSRLGGDCWFGLFLPDPGDIFSAKASSELSMIVSVFKILFYFK